MHLPKPVGPFHVAFADFELRPSGGEDSVTIHPSDAEANELKLKDVPPMRFFYPTAAEPKWCLMDTQSRRWLPHFNYTWGYFSKVIQPSSYLRRFAIWTLTCAYLNQLIPTIFLQFLIRVFGNVGWLGIASHRSSSDWY